MDLSQPWLLSSKILIHTKKLQRNQPILDFLCNIQSKRLKQSNAPSKFEMVLHILSFRNKFGFIFLIQNVLLWEVALLSWGQKHLFFKQVWLLHWCPYPVLSVSPQSWLKLVSESLCKQTKVLVFFQQVLVFSFLKIKTRQNKIHWCQIILPSFLLDNHLN